MADGLKTISAPFRPSSRAPSGKVPVVADVDADRRVARLEHRVAEVAGLEEVLLPEARGVRDVVLAVLAEVAAVGVVDRGGVVVDAGLLALVDRDDHRHLVFLRARSAISSVVGPGTGSAMSYQCASCDGQK